MDSSEDFLPIAGALDGADEGESGFGKAFLEGGEQFNDPNGIFCGLILPMLQTFRDTGFVHRGVASANSRTPLGTTLILASGTA